MEKVLFDRVGRITRVSATLVVVSPNAMHSVLYLVLVFINASVRIFLLQVEFMGRIFRVVYVGAIAVLFRFVVMLLNVTLIMEDTQKELSVGERRNVARLVRIALGLVGSRVRIVSQEHVELKSGEVMKIDYVEWTKLMDKVSNIEALGQMRYTDGLVYVILAGFILLVAIIGAIVLTLKVRTFALAKRQQVHQQRSRDADRAIRLVRESKK